ncbi:DUF1254 domain-containing protein [Afipia massiliensis]|uniref:DUF1254 domain-containing protein n=1 Tax=Afipia massiliensis TaxID=211460 RepID=A0A4U6BMM3_9BRAD|nr:DUF1254 domain-containing protein [Afipia massiliensis]TKT71660.1 DUF1254 domain-containing protein [Afipia massiliensis]
MEIICKKLLAAAAISSALSLTCAYAQVPKPGENPTPGFNNKIPDKILTPDKIETRIGTLNFVDGVPTVETSQKVYDHLDFLRGVEVFLNFIPAASVEAIRLGNAELGAVKSNQGIIFDQLLDSSPLLLTGNTDTVYCLVTLDLKADGPTVVEVPPGTGPGTVDDAFFRFVVDMGAPGPDRGQGGKYLIVPSSYKGELPKDKKDGGDYFIAHSPSNVNLLVLRGFLVDGKPDAASKLFREGLKVYSLSKASNPPKMEFFNASKVPYNTVHANNFEFFQEVDHVIQNEPMELFDPELRGIAASIGIRKGQKFAPDARMKATLTESVAVANATARSIGFRNRDPRSAIYPNSQWKSGFVGSDYRWMDIDGVSGRNHDARTNFFYLATVNTPAMAAKIIGRGSQYAMTYVDAAGNPFDGAKTYKVNIPKNVPAQDFWSVVLYDPQTRSELQTSQPFPSKNNKRDKMAVNADGSVDLYFSPKAPAGKEANWIASVPGKSWFTIFRLYGPLEPWFDKTWRPGEIEEVK